MLFVNHFFCGRAKSRRMEPKAPQIKELRKRLGWTQRRLSAELGVSEFAIRSWEQGQSRPSAMHIIDLAKIAGPIDASLAERLMTLLVAGRGKHLTAMEAFNLVKNQMIDEETVIPAHPREPADPEIVKIPMVATVAAGMPVLQSADVEDWLPFQARFIRALLRAANAGVIVEPRLVLVRVDKKSGDSMMPTLHPGDLLMIDRGDCLPPFPRRNIYAVRYEEGVTLKRLTLQGRRLILRPDNPDFDPTVLDLPAGEQSGRIVLGRVVWQASVLL